MKSILLSICGAITILAASVPAQAGRTAVDQDADGNKFYRSASGYCDIDGSNFNDCVGKSLPYSVHFVGLDYNNTGEYLPYSTNSVLNYGNGRLAFGDYYGAFPTADGQLFNPFITGGIDDSISRDALFQFALDQSTSLEIKPNGNIRMVAYYCVSTTACDITNYVLDLVPHANGFAATVAYSMFEPLSYGYDQFDSPLSGRDKSYTPVTSPAGKTFTFFIPVEISGLPEVGAVPEPSSWLAMLIGFGLTGATMRRRQVAVVNA